MKRKVITALGITEFNKVLVEDYGQQIEVITHDLERQEELFDALAVKEDCEVIILLDKLPGPLSKSELIGEIIKLQRPIKIIVIMEEYDDEYKRFLRKNGIVDSFEFSDADVDEIVQAVLFRGYSTTQEDDTTETQESSYINNEVAATTEVPNNVIPTVPQIEKKFYVKKEVIAVCPPGGGGGVGRTTISINLGILAAKKYPASKVVIADFNEEKPDICRNLNIESEKGLHEVSKQIINNELNVLECLERHEKITNLYFLPGVKSPDESDSFSAFHYKEIIKQLKSEFDLVIIDTGYFNSNSTYAAIDRSTRVLFMIRDTEATVSNCKEKLDYYENEIGVSVKSKAEFILNMKVGYEKLNKDALEVIFGKPILADFDYSQEIIILNEKYKPFVLDGSMKMKRYKSKLNKALDSLVTFVEQKERKKFAFLGRR